MYLIVSTLQIGAVGPSIVVMWYVSVKLLPRTRYHYAVTASPLVLETFDAILNPIVTMVMLGFHFYFFSSAL